MLKGLVLSVVLLLTLNVQAGSCTAFQGIWDAQGEAKFHPIRISTSANNYLIIDFNLFQNDSTYSQQFTERYVADGSEHMGDGRYTGNWYTVTCTNERMTITRDFQFSHLLVYDYYFSGEMLVVEEKLGRRMNTSLYVRR